MDKQTNKKSRYTDSQKQAIYKYMENKTKTEIVTTKEIKEQIKQAASGEHKSVNQFILDCVFEHMNKTQN